MLKSHHLHILWDDLIVRHVLPGHRLCRKHLDAAKHMVKLHSDRLELFDQMRGASGGKLHSARERAARSLGELKAAISAARQVIESTTT